MHTVILPHSQCDVFQLKLNGPQKYCVTQAHTHTQISEIPHADPDDPGHTHTDLNRDVKSPNIHRETEITL